MIQCAQAMAYSGCVRSHQLLRISLQLRGQSSPEGGLDDAVYLPVIIPGDLDNRPRQRTNPSISQVCVWELCQLDRLAVRWDCLPGGSYQP